MALVSASSFSLSFETSSFTSCSSFSSFLLSSSSSLLSLLPFLLLPTAFFFEDFFADGETASFSPSFSCDILALLLFLSSLPPLPDAEEVDGASFFSSCKCSTNFNKVFNLGRKVRNLTTVASKIFTKRARASSALPGVVSARRRKIDSTKWCINLAHVI